ncbi:MAG: bifunctional phosphoribosylaminoimidazolecarboxamide formyltransferase/IMP cyclohydrolase, partial [Pseudomonadota bacterium]
MESLNIKRALLSVSNKQDLIWLAEALLKHKIRLISTGGSAKTLKEAGIAVTYVHELTGFPEIMDGRVKTLHPSIHAAILADRDNPKHCSALEAYRIQPIDLVVVNLYRFDKALAEGAGEDDCLEHIDIGGPAMIRAAAKNFRHVAIVTNPDQYHSVTRELEQNDGRLSIALRRKLASRAYHLTSSYDAMIADWFTGLEADPATIDRTDDAGDRLQITGQRLQQMRYGENPHQSAALYATDDADGLLARATLLQGKECSYTNWLDSDAALLLASEFEDPAAVIIKHVTPCGAASAAQPDEALDLALASDPESAFGGIVGLNRPVDAAVAARLAEFFLEVVIAPDFHDDALAILAAKPNLRLLKVGKLEGPQSWQSFKSIRGGMVRQREYKGITRPEDWNHACGPRPDQSLIEALSFAMLVAKHARSNAIA